MHADLEKLIVLQRHDLEAKRLRDEMDALPKQVAAAETKAKAVEGQRAVVLALIAKEEALRRGQESDAKDLRAKAERLRKQLDSATTTTQVTAYEHEIAFATGEIDRLETAELESMERSEELDAQKMRADEAVLDARAAHEREVVRVGEKMAADKVLLAETGGARKAVRAEVDEDWLGKYDRIAKAKGTAVSEARDHKCTVCQMMIRPQKWNELRERDNDEIMSCDSCGRLLFYDPARDAPQKKTVKSESIAASIVRSSI